MRAINLLPRDDYRRRRQKHQQAQWVVVVPVIGAVLLSAMLSVLFISASGFTIEGYTYSQSAVALLLARLGVVPDLVNVQLQGSTLQDSSGAKVVHFNIAADVRSPGGGS